mgnify:CR=1 FL=1
MTTAAEYLYALPKPVQTQLVRLTRAAAGLSGEEKADVLAAFCGVAEAFLVHRPLTRLAVVEMVDAVGQVITEIDRAAYPRTEGEVV